MSLATIVATMAASGCTPDQIAATVRAYEESRMSDERESARVEAARLEADREARREGNRKRQAEKRARAEEEVRIARTISHAVTDGTDTEISHVCHAVTGTGHAVTPGSHAVTNVTGVSPEVPPKENNQNPLLPLSPVSETRASPERRGMTGAHLAAKADEFYAAYPKKVNPSDAKAKFIRVCRAGVDPDHVIAAAGRFAEANRLAGMHKQYIQAPAVWLNKGGYDSEDLPEPRAGPSKSRNLPLGRNGKPSIQDFVRAQDDRINGPDRDVFGESPGEVRPFPGRQLPAWRG